MKSDLNRRRADGCFRCPMERAHLLPPTESVRRRGPEGRAKGGALSHTLDGSGIRKPEQPGVFYVTINESIYIDLLNRREYQALEALATKQLSQTGDELSALLIAHSRIRRGMFSEALASLNDLERACPDRRAFVHDIASMCTREYEAIAAESDPSERERLNDMDLWYGSPASSPVVGQVVLDDGRQAAFADAADLDRFVGRKLLVFGLDRAWRIPFESLATVELVPKSPMTFDDLWIPAKSYAQAWRTDSEDNGASPRLLQGFAHPQRSRNRFGSRNQNEKLHSGGTA
jgi:hypothetical protein